MSELFGRGVDFAAAPDTFPPDRFNAGVMVVRPSASLLAQMKAQAGSLASYDGGDTGFLNAFFPGWFELPAASRLPFRFNALRTMHHMTSKKPAYWESLGRCAESVPAIATMPFAGGCVLTEASTLQDRLHSLLFISQALGAGGVHPVGETVVGAVRTVPAGPNDEGGRRPSSSPGPQ